MRSVKRRFDAFKEQNPWSGDVINLGRAVRGQRVSRERLGRFFVRLIDRSENTPSEKKEILNWLFSESMSEAYVKKGEKAPRRRERDEGDSDTSHVSK